ncbi:MAG: hypothetical protein NVSMB52_17940 [Chloroflexota bacterium]
MTSDRTSNYFSADQNLMSSTAKGTWVDTSTDVTPFEMLPGLSFRPVLGEGVLVNMVEFAPHTAAPLHAHSEEQIALVLEGELEFEVNGETRVLGPGMVVVIPPGAPHAARSLDAPCRAVDIFNPPRQALVDAMGLHSPGSRK